MSVPSREAGAQAAAIRRRRGDQPTAATATAAQALPLYAGLVTRSIAFTLDAAIVNAVAALFGIAVGLAISILHLPEEVDVILASVGAAAWVIWSVAYFAFFWSTTGQTPGGRLMRIRVIDGGGRRPLKPLRAATRFSGLLLAAIPLGAGFWMMLWDDRRRCLQDRLVRTVVVNTPPRER